MNREEHLRAITVVGTTKRYKRLGLLMLCSGPDCGGADLFADGLSAAAVATAAEGHLAQYADATSSQDGWGFTAVDEAELADVVAAARLAGMITGTGRFSRAILGAGYRRTQPPSPCWELRNELADWPANPAGEPHRPCVPGCVLSVPHLSQCQTAASSCSPAVQHG